MKQILLTILLALSLCEPVKANDTKIGLATYYSISTNGGSTTSSGVPLSDNKLTAASVIFPLKSKLLITNLTNGKSITVTVTDTGPFATNSNGRAIRPLRAHPSRIVDVSLAAAKALSFHGKGIAKVKVQKLK